MRRQVIWSVLIAALVIPLGLAATSPLLAWRQPIYIAAGFAGVAGMALLLVQPLLAAGVLPGLDPRKARRIHRITGTALVLLVVVHVGGLWITSPPDVIDALLFRSPTLFTPFGVVAMWAVFAAAVLAAMRGRWHPKRWRTLHLGLAVLIVPGTVAHAVLIDGTMESISKYALSVLVLIALAVAIMGSLQNRRTNQLSRKN